MKKYIVFNIGCLECGVSSNIVGVFKNKDKALKIKKICDEKYSWRKNGDNDFIVFELPESEVINSEYDL